MKANEAPEKLYIFNPEKREVWFSKTSDKQVEYVRTDAFIEKACSFLQDRMEHDSIDYPMATHWLIEDFKKYMEDNKCVNNYHYFQN